MNTGKVVLGILAGIAIGAMAGILFAPEKGSRIRKRIMNKGNDFADELKSKSDDFFESITEKFDATKNETEDMISKGKAKFNEVKKEA